jgi:hypothetical protein
MESTITGSGLQADTELQIDPSFQAARVSLKPLEYTEPGKTGLGGHYYIEGITGALTGVGANGPIFSCRWSDSRYLMVLKRVSVWYNITTAYTTAQMNDFELIFATAFTASDTGGGALVPIPKRRAAMAPGSAITDMRLSTTAALSAGTRTLDATALRFVQDGPPNVAIPTATLAVPRNELLLYDNKEFGVHPKILGKDEGFIVRMPTAMGAVGVIRASVMAEWAEVLQY